MTILRDDDAVSPVIGVILMVAITVILAAVIAAFVFGMAGKLQQSRMVSASWRHVGDEIFVTYNGGPDADQVVSLKATIDGTDPGHLSTAIGSVVSKGGYPTKAHVMVVATFIDGSSQIIADAFI
jgi:flagellin-like protein